ncbi:S8/S53 family peptidase [Catenuloplanes sp. NPDC051500]|uniref:S8/S53 family peptidase n=1 Tax=Catenuloplanes sp. NPDC051500 TaxID=3363959 RepID=UPI0037924201
MPRNHDRPSPDSELRADTQVGLLLHDYGLYAAPGPENWAEVGIKYFVRRRFVLVRSEFAAAARDLLRHDPPLLAPPHADPLPGEPADGDVAYGIEWIRIVETEDITVFTALKRIREGLRRTVNRDIIEPGDASRTPRYAGVAGPELLVHVAHDHGTVCPSEEPHPVCCDDRPDPPVVPDDQAGLGVKVLVIDTGLDPAATSLPWMKGVCGDPDPGLITTNSKTTISRYAGHGTFIAGLIRTVAPAAEVVVRLGVPAPVHGHTHPAGTMWEGDLADAIRRGLLFDQPDIINLSAGTVSGEPSGPMILTAFHEQVLRHQKGLVLVAAAGNDGIRQRFWPAAAPWAVGVGALAQNRRRRADFSNSGSWVDVYAPGERLVNAFPRGNYTYEEPKNRGTARDFDGLARWSGTSFAAPLVAGLIASRMSRTGENGERAARRLLARSRRHHLPGVGPVLLP